MVEGKYNAAAIIKQRLYIKLIQFYKKLNITRFEICRNKADQSRKFFYNI